MELPILDWQNYATETDSKGFAEALGKACRDTGFFLLKNHSVPEKLIAEVFSKADQFFALPISEKEKISILKNPHNRGWSAIGSESLDEKSGQSDRKEAFNVGLDLAANDPRILNQEPFRGVNVWPEIDGFRQTMLNYYQTVWDLGRSLLDVFESDLNLPNGFFKPHFDAPLAILRVLSYPASQNSDGIGAGAHSDYGAITLLMTDGVGGLQVKPRGKDWIDVPHVPGAFIVNIGDCLMRWSNDIYVSTPHRVLPPKQKRRSIAFFLDPNPDSLIETLPGTGEPKYPPVTGADYLRSRLDATFGVVENKM